MKTPIIAIILIATLLALIEEVESFSNKNEDDSSSYDGSCICGLNKDILDQLERIIERGTIATCEVKPGKEEGNGEEDKNNSNHDNDDPSTSPSSSSSSSLSEHDVAGTLPTVPSSGSLNEQILIPEKNEHDDFKEESNKLEDNFNLPSTAQGSLTNLQPLPAAQQSTTSTTTTTTINGNLQTKLPINQNGIESTSTTISDIEEKPVSVTEVELISKLTAEIHRLESIINKPHSITSSTSSLGTITTGNIPTTSVDHHNEATITTTTSSSSNNQLGASINGGFLSGVHISPISLPNSINSNLEESQQQQIKPNEMAVVIQSTVPNVVSNIFSNIHNFTLDTENNPLEKPNYNEPTSLTSINGQSASIQGLSSESQILAQGEKLFLAWIEQQIETLNLTASMALYIRKSALNLFRRIVRQYVDRMERVGGSIELNVQRATQLALNNTQNLIAFLLKHYLYYAGGLMRIIGEQVSRTGQQLDSTGKTISHLEINPFDIISKVMDTLPNPSDYSKYFRNIGKHLIGDLSWNSNKQPIESTSSSLDDDYSGNQAQTDQQQSQSITKPGQSSDIFRKTMSSLGKTFTSWIG